MKIKTYDGIQTGLNKNNESNCTKARTSQQPPVELDEAASKHNAGRETMRPQKRERLAERNAVIVKQAPKPDINLQRQKKRDEPEPVLLLELNAHAPSLQVREDAPSDEQLEPP